MEERKTKVVLNGEVLDAVLNDISEEVKYNVKDTIPSISLNPDILYLVEIKIQEVTDALLQKEL